MHHFKLSSALQGSVPAYLLGVRPRLALPACFLVVEIPTFSLGLWYQQSSVTDHSSQEQQRKANYC
jgi:hypothetical protein